MRALLPDASICQSSVSTENQRGCTRLNIQGRDEFSEHHGQPKTGERGVLTPPWKKPTKNGRAGRVNAPVEAATGALTRPARRPLKLLSRFQARKTHRHGSPANIWRTIVACGRPGG